MNFFFEYFLQGLKNVPHKSSFERRKKNNLLFFLFASDKTRIDISINLYKTSDYFYLHLIFHFLIFLQRHLIVNVFEYLKKNNLRLVIFFFLYRKEDLHFIPIYVGCILYTLSQDYPSFILFNYYLKREREKNLASSFLISLSLSLCMYPSKNFIDHCAFTNCY